MEAAQIEAPGQARVIDSAKPSPGADDVLIEVAVAGICGTDLHIFRGEYEAVYPLIPGHEFSGTVVAVGENVRRYKIGDRVTADPNIPCQRCPACQRNEPNQCENLAAIGVTRNGGFAQYVIAPEGNVFSIGDLSFAQAALIEPLACVRVGVEAGPGAARRLGADLRRGSDGLFVTPGDQTFRRGKSRHHRLGSVAVRTGRRVGRDGNRVSRQPSGTAS